MSEDESDPDGLRWFLKTDDRVIAYSREVVGDLLVVVVVVLLLFGVSGVWPPLVAAETESMEPQISEGDLLFVMEEQRFSPPFAVRETGIVTYLNGKKHGYRKFGDYGDVIVFQPRGVVRDAVIHRAHFWVNDSENWFDEANESYLSGDSCEEIPNCPAPHSGFITKGANNELYDQANGVTPPVRPSQIHATAEIRIPYLGYVQFLYAPSSPANLLLILSFWKTGRLASSEVHSRF